MPTASSSHAPALSTALAATMSWKPAGSTATQTPTPTRHVPPACRGRSGDDHGVRGCPRLGPLSGMGVTHPSQTEMSPHVDGGCLNPWSPPWDRCHPPLSQLEMLLPRHRFPPPLYPTGPRWTHEHQHVEDEHQVLHAAQDTHGDTGRGGHGSVCPYGGESRALATASPGLSWTPWPQQNVGGCSLPKFPDHFVSPLSPMTPQKAPNLCPLQIRILFQPHVPFKPHVPSPTSLPNPVSPPNPASPTNPVYPLNPVFPSAPTPLTLWGQRVTQVPPTFPGAAST